MGLRTGDQYTLGELLAGVLLRSGNDAAVAVAEHIAGTVEAFVELMNEKALEIGATNTHFTNPHGLDEQNHYTTAYDLAVMTRYAMRQSKFAELVATREKLVDSEDRPREWALRNTNRLLWNYQGADGVKTGTTGQAGNCLVASATRGQLHLISVVLNSGSRWSDASQLLDWGFSSFTVRFLVRRGEVVAQVPVKNGTDDKVEIVAGEDLLAVVPREKGALVSTRAEFPDTLPAPVFEGQPVGTLFAEVSDQPLAQIPLVASTTVNSRLNWQSFIEWVRPFWIWFFRIDPSML